MQNYEYIFVLFIYELFKYLNFTHKRKFQLNNIIPLPLTTTKKLV